MAIMTFTWYFIRHKGEFIRGRYPILSDAGTNSSAGRPILQRAQTSKFISREVVDVNTVDLYADEHIDDSDDAEDDARRAAKRKGQWGLFWRLYDIVV